MNKYVGIYDSGIGGITACKELKKQLPNENVVFFGDTLNMPYGNKSNEELISLSINNVNVLSRYDLKAVVVACNTSDAVCKEAIIEKYHLPVFGVLRPTAIKAVNTTKNKRIGIMATISSIKNGKYTSIIKELNKDIKTYDMPCPKLASLIEEGCFIGEDLEFYKQIDEYVSPLIKQDVDTIILGCTHYDLIKEYVEDKYNVNVISSSRCFVSDLKEYLKDNNLLNDKLQAEDVYLVNANLNTFNKVAQNIIPNIKIKDA